MSHLPIATSMHKLILFPNSVLVHRWRYFFPHKCESAESARRTEELRGALTALGQALLTDDIELLRTALSALDLLNTKWKLYSRVIDHTIFQYRMCLIL